MATSVKHETRALLRAHLSAASSYGHLTRRCPVCHRLQRLALATAPANPQPAGETLETGEDESPGEA
ncbi:DUF6274 family protein [Streptomyces sp. NPDC014006]|uniref:DUF6274 family protein n=1 Tax=Streptomyces sp. NPDC014006 TaxID=3364870 RepID=UPI0036FDE7FD